MAEDLFEEEIEEVEAQEEPQEEVQEEPQEEVVPKTQYDNIHQAMDRERHETRELQAQFDDYRRGQEEKLARLDERLNVLNKNFGYEEPEEDHVERTLLEQQETLKAQQERLKEIELSEQLRNQEHTFSSQTPDYLDAKTYYWGQRREALTEMGLNENEINNEIMREVTNLVDRSLKNNKNVAEGIYNAAKKAGFRSTVDEKKKKQAEKIQSIEKGQSAAMPSSGTVRKPLTVEELANMPEEEFMKLSDEVINSAMRG